MARALGFSLFVLVLLALSTSVLARDAVPSEKIQAFAQPELDASAFLPEPPAFDSVLFLQDRARYEQGRSLRGTTRALKAAEDANTKILPELFSEAFGTSISREQLPELYTLIQRVRKTVSSATHKLKRAYWRMRPFVLYGDETCYPAKEASHKLQSSYPSGHSACGFAVALLLSEINPGRADKILARGVEYGQSRVICGYHWQSDVDVARVLASALMAQLHANVEFQEALARAKDEYAKHVAEQADAKP
ncbi:MAG: phosphatase PAP2 family protein [Lachnospiraceae bacterium]|nr:phosphatase PAP2 family protein [Lachnospiraceae bacterium]